jgi:hypothetical protein
MALMMGEDTDTTSRGSHVFPTIQLISTKLDKELTSQKPVVWSQFSSMSVFCPKCSVSIQLSG